VSLLGCIADDLTGATDLANTLVKEGMRTVQAVGVPAPGQPAPDADAIVVALKSRTIPAGEAVAQSLAALAWLRRHGTKRFLFKYCSTFDSTDAGNIGPVADALLDALGSDFTIYCPSFPETGRTVYRGHLFVGDLLLSDSPMRDHPLTPMRDANLARVLARQTPHRVGLVAYETVRAGPRAIRAAFAGLRADGVRHAVVDAIDDVDLRALAEAAAELPLVTGGSGIARGMPKALAGAGSRAGAGNGAAALPPGHGLGAVLAGSCSAATRRQVARWAADRPALRLDPMDLADPERAAAAAADWARARLGDGPVLVYSTADPDTVAAAQAALGREAAAERVEAAMAAIARALVAAGVGRLVVAGGETAGAVVAGLGVRALAIGGEIDPGVPWTMSLDPPGIALALKSGNFGGEDFFAKALATAP